MENFVQKNIKVTHYLAENVKMFQNIDILVVHTYIK